MSVRQILDSTGKVAQMFLPPFIANDLLSPVAIAPPAPATAGNVELIVNGNAASPYGGGLSLNPGANSVAAQGAVGVNIRATATGCAVEVGTDGAGVVNTLGIAGEDGVAEVYNPLYNQPMALRPLTLSNTNPLCAPDPNNVGELFRCAQAGVVAASVAAIGTSFEVSRTGFYTLQIEVKMANDVAPAAPDINIAMVDVGGFDIGNTLTLAIVDGVVVEPYGVHEFVSSEFAVGDITEVGGNVIRLHSSQHLLQAGTEYSFTLRATNAGGAFNIGAAGQIKAELIAMC